MRYGNVFLCFSERFYCVKYTIYIFSQDYLSDNWFYMLLCLNNAMIRLPCLNFDYEFIGQLTNQTKITNQMGSTCPFIQDWSSFTPLNSVSNHWTIASNPMVCTQTPVNKAIPSLLCSGYHTVLAQLSQASQELV